MESDDDGNVSAVPHDGLPLKPSWSERALTDASLRAYVHAEIARAGIELDTIRYQLEIAKANEVTWSHLVDRLKAELKTAEKRANAAEKRAGIAPLPKARKRRG